MKLKTSTCDNIRRFEFEVSSLKFPVLAAIALLTLHAQGASSTLVTATITVTNAPTTNGQTLTVNGDTRTWTNNLTIPASQILTNATIGGSATNMFTALADAPIGSPALSLLYSSTNGVSLSGAVNQNITVTLSAGWGQVVYTTNTLTSAIAIRVPHTVEAAPMQTNLMSLLLTGLSQANTNSFYESDAAVSHLVGLTNNQTISGVKQLTNVADLYQGVVSNSPDIGGIVQALTNGLWWFGTAPFLVTTNGTNFGNAFTSKGSGAGSEQFGLGASASGNLSTAVGRLSTASNPGDVALGYASGASGGNSTALGAASSATVSNATAVGTVATATGTNSTALGRGATATGNNSTAVGYAATTTADNQVMLGSSGVSTVVNNYLSVLGGATIANGVTNLLHTGTNNFPAGSDLSFGRYALSTLANGNNAAVPVGTNVFIEVSGPTSAFTINGINASPNRDGKFIILLNQTGQNMTIANQSGTDPTAANRIVCLTGADKTVTGNSSAMLIYSGSASRWILLNFTQ